MIQASVEIDETQIQPASLDLRLGTQGLSGAGELSSGQGQDRRGAARRSSSSTRSTSRPARCWSAAPSMWSSCMEHLNLPESVSALANPKSSTGRLDVFTRLIADHSDMFDSVPGGYQGRIYTEISPCSFSIRVRKGSRLNQIRFRRRNPAQAETAKFALSRPRAARAAQARCRWSTARSSCATAWS